MESKITEGAFLFLTLSFFLFSLVFFPFLPICAVYEFCGWHDVSSQSLHRFRQSILLGVHDIAGTVLKTDVPKEEICVKWKIYGNLELAQSRIGEANIPKHGNAELLRDSWATKSKKNMLLRKIANLLSFDMPKNESNIFTVGKSMSSISLVLIRNVE